MLTEGFSRADRPAHLILDREADLADLDTALADVASGEGYVLVIEGPAGIGKTALMSELRRRALAQKLTVLSARAGELERDFGFGVVRQLLEAPLAVADHAERQRLLAGAASLAEPVFTAASIGQEGAGDDVAYATLHGLYWLVANLAESAPVVLAVDDAHWADEPSLRFLIHLATRLAGMPVLTVLATRTGAEASRPQLRSLLLEARGPILHPRPLGAAAVERLVTAGLGVDAVVLSDACREATGGNPFLLVELIGELRREARPVGEIDPGVVRRLGPERIADAVLLRIGRLDHQAPALARSVAVLGRQAGLLTCAQLAGLESSRARELADALTDLAVLEPGEQLQFTHPIVRTAIYEDIPAAQRAEMHAGAARVLTDHGADAESVAVHLMATDPAGDPAVVTALRAAAHRALAGGAPDAAAAALRRALAEPPGETDRPLVLFDLGTAEHQLGAASAGRHLREAGETTADPVLRARAYCELAADTDPRPAQLRGQIPLYEKAAEEVLGHDRELALELEAARLGGLLHNPDHLIRFEEQAERFRDLPGQTAAECLLLSFFARRLLAGGGNVEAADLAERASAHPAWMRSRVRAWQVNTTYCLIAAERYDAAEQLLTHALRHAERTGYPFGFAKASWLRAQVRHRRGELRGAESDGRAALHRIHGRTGTLFPLIDVLVDQGRLAESEDLLVEFGYDGALPEDVAGIQPHIARGRLRAARGDLVAARTDLEAALQLNERFRWLIPRDDDTRVALVLVLDALGEHRDARALADEALRIATTRQSSRAIGGALRVAGLVNGGTKGIELLRQSVDHLAASPSVLCRAEALVDFGAALRRDGQSEAARDALRDGVDLAHRCAATALVDRATRELRATGARPRRLARTGADALTGSERRVAELAAEGMTNKEIAQALFVTLRTVEMHLSSTYGKLQISSRRELDHALDG